MSDNPLMQFARHPELTVKLASPKSWYPEGFIRYTLNDEVEVYPMLPKDELMLYNPDALVSGQAMIDLIKSCCPSVLDPSKLYYPDANIILLAIKRATYGNDHKQAHLCPKCEEMVNKLKEEDPNKLEKLLKDGKLYDHSEEFTFNIDELLMGIKKSEEEYTQVIEGLTFTFQPLTMSAKEKFSFVTSKNNKLIRIYSDIISKTEELSPDEKSELKKQINLIQSDIISTNNDILALTIKSVQLPDGSIVSEHDKIKEFIDNAEIQIVEKLGEGLKRINDVGLPSSLKVTCSACGNEWEVPFEGFNQSDFFV